MTFLTRLQNCQVAGAKDASGQTVAAFVKCHEIIEHLIATKVKSAAVADRLMAIVEDKLVESCGLIASEK